MKNRSSSNTDRRSFLREAAVITCGGALTASGVMTGLSGFAQNPPGGCPAPPTGGTPFVPGHDKRPITLRKSINSYSGAELAQFQNAFTTLRNLPSNDPRTWILQADLHALYCQQCNNDNAQIHGSWNFFPWHRAYLYYYERILGSLVGNLDGFRLPYWDWENIRTLPIPYSTPGSGSNPLWDQNRNSGLAGGGNLPPSDGTQAHVNFLNGILDFATFGGTAIGSGNCELNPHNVIHNDVGLPFPVFVDMGDLGFAARDPIFFGHHCNIDKLWSNWNGLAGGGSSPGAYENPTVTGFLNAQWSFYDENKNVVSITAADVLDNVNNLRYTYQQVKRHFVPFEVILECRLVYRGPGPDPGPFLQVSQQARESLLAAEREHLAVALVLLEVTFPGNISGTFDIFAVRGDRKTQLGTFAFVHERGMRMKERIGTLVLDATKALGDLTSIDRPASIHVVPRVGKQTFVLRAKRAEFRVQRRRG